MQLLISLLSSFLWFFRSPFHKGFFTLYSYLWIILTLHLSFIWDFTWVSVLSDTSSGSLWVVITRILLFRCHLHINAVRKVITVHFIRWQQLFFRSFGLSPLSFKSIGHILLSWASWKLPPRASYLRGPMLDFYYLLAISSNVLLSSDKPMAQHIISSPYPHK